MRHQMENTTPKNSSKSAAFATNKSAYKRKSINLKDEDTIIFKPKNYYLPGRHQFGKYQVEVNRKDIEDLASNGNQWTTIEQLYQVSFQDLRVYFECEFNRGKAKLEVALNQKLVAKAMANDTTTAIWLSKNKLNMSEKTTNITETKPETAPEEVEAKIGLLLKKLNFKSGE